MSPNLWLLVFVFDSLQVLGINRKSLYTFLRQQHIHLLNVPCKYSYNCLAIPAFSNKLFLPKPTIANIEKNKNAQNFAPGIKLKNYITDWTLNKKWNLNALGYAMNTRPGPLWATSLTVVPSFSLVSEKWFDDLVTILYFVGQQYEVAERDNQKRSSWAMYPRTEKMTNPESIDAVKLILTNTRDHFYCFSHIVSSKVIDPNLT